MHIDDCIYDCVYLTDSVYLLYTEQAENINPSPFP